MDENKQLFIPDKIKVGFQNRNDTYTKKLAYVIYYDMKGELRKEKSWQTWRDKKIDPIDYNNEPTEGFVLNKKVGGYKCDWNYRDAHVRVYDPRDFEFEISVPNLLFILTQCDCSRGKGLEGKFVYAWDGTELLLLPVSSEAYKASKKYTVLQSQSVKAKELVPGASYITKKQEMLTFVGKFDWHAVGHGGYKPVAALTKKYVFWNGKNFVDLKDIKTIAALVQPDVVPDLAELQEHYYKSPYGSKVVGLSLRDIPKKILNKKQDGWRTSYNWFYEIDEVDIKGDVPETRKVYVECYSQYDNYYSNQKTATITQINTTDKVWLKDGSLFSDSYYTSAYSPKLPKQQHYYGDRGGTWVEPTGKALWATLESGAEYMYKDEQLITNKEADHGEG